MIDNWATLEGACEALVDLGAVQGESECLALKILQTRPEGKYLVQTHTMCRIFFNPTVRLTYLK